MIMQQQYALKTGLSGFDQGFNPLRVRKNPA
jgi:hypothetical protein